MTSTTTKRLHPALNVTARFVCDAATVQERFALGLAVPVVITREGHEPRAYVLSRVEGGYRFRACDKGTVSDVTCDFGGGAECMTCTCGDATWRERQDRKGCRHRRAVEALGLAN